MFKLRRDRARRRYQISGRRSTGRESRARDDPHSHAAGRLSPLALATSFVAMRFADSRSSITNGTAAFTVILLVLGIVEWYDLEILVDQFDALVRGMAATSALLIPLFVPPAGHVRGSR